jgi:hypothetical protein
MNKQQPNSGTNTPTDLSANKVKKFQNGWTEEQEILLAKWADYAACYRWLHDRTEKKLSRANNRITIPVIILSTIVGTASVGLNGLVGDIPNGQKYGQISIGIVSLFTGILTTLGNYFRYAQNSEAHKVAAISWGKFNRLITVELAQKPDDRMDSLNFLSICRQDLDRLIEQSPQVPNDIITLFAVEFEDQEELHRPDICNNIEHTTIYNNSKTRMKMMVAEMAMNLRHKKKLLREEILPDLDKRMKKIVEDSIKEYEVKIKSQTEKDKHLTFLTDVRKKLGEVVGSMQEIHVSEVENVKVDIIGESAVKPKLVPKQQPSSTTVNA